MVIAVNTRLLLTELEGYGYFIRELFELLARDHPDHQFYFLFDRPFDPRYVFSKNIIPVVIPPPARLPILWKYWFDIKIPRVLGKIKADIFVSPDGYCSLTTKVPQCLVIHDLGFLHFAEGYQRSHVRFLKNRTPRFLKKAEQVVTVSRYSREDLLTHYPADPARVHVIYNGVKNLFQPLPEEQKDAARNQFTGGMEFFLYVGAVHPRKNLVNLLRAFSLFKKRMQSGMKLVIAGRLAWKNDEFLQLVKTYKYRDEVVITGYLPEKELAQLMASAYALVYPSLFEGFGVPVAEAMRCGVPVLTSRHSSMEEVAGDAALYFDPRDPVDMADKLMVIYRDEDLKKQLSEKGIARSTRFSWERSAKDFWQIILNTANKTG